MERLKSRQNYDNVLILTKISVFISSQDVGEMKVAVKCNLLMAQFIYLKSAVY